MSYNNCSRLRMEDKFHAVISLVPRNVSLGSFQKYILHSEEYKGELFVNIRQSKTEGLPRFNVWRLLLEVLPIDGSWEKKHEQLQTSRKRWAVLREQARTGIKSTGVKEVAMPKNPLMKGLGKPQKKETQSDTFLNQEIKKDVDRTYQEMDFFRDASILKLLSNVLFVWSKINSDISYKQGINEILASVVYVYFQEAVPKEFHPSNETQQKYATLCSTQYVQADVFAVFQKMMEIQKEMYKQNLDSGVKELMNPNSKHNSPILQRIIQIQDQKLKALDLQLFRVMKLQNVITKTFLLRWIRCMHTRQFGLVGSLGIWDSIFLDAFQSPNSKNKHQFQFVDAMCLAMFIYLRSLVLTRQTANQILQIYQKYPQLEGQYLHELIGLAWSVCEELRNLTHQSHTSDVVEQNGKSSNFVVPSHSSPVKKNESEQKKNRLDKSKPAQLKQIEGKSNDLLLNKKQVGLSKSSHVYQFEEAQILSAVQLLRQSISYNQDVQSKQLAKKVLAILQLKLSKQ